MKLPVFDRAAPLSFDRYLSDTPTGKPPLGLIAEYAKTLIRADRGKTGST